MQYDDFVLDSDSDESWSDDVTAAAVEARQRASSSTRATVEAIMSRTETKQQLDEKAQRLAPWIAACAQLLDGPLDVDEMPTLPVRILPYLILGDAHCADSIERLNALGVTHVLNAAGDEARMLSDYGEIEHLQLNAMDVNGYDMLQHWSTADAFIRRATNGGCCLVHCAAGVNRSGLLACAAKMLHEGICVLDALAACQRARKLILTNEGFRLQLVQLAHGADLLGDAPSPTAV